MDGEAALQRGLAKPERAGIPRRTLLTLMMVSGLGWICGCSSVTEPNWVKEFRWSPASNPGTLEPGVAATSALSVLYVQGRLKTPSHCYALGSDFQKKGSKLTLRVRAEPRNGTNCDSGVGGFEYTAVIGDLARRTYELRVIHDVTGGAGGEFTLTATVVQ